MAADNEFSAEMIVSFFPGLKWRPNLKLLKVATPDNPLFLAGGSMLKEVVVAYETYGHLAADGSNAVLVTHALTGDSHPGAHGQYDEQGWWEPLTGAGRPLDTKRFFLICANVLGGCQGTTGPASPNPATGQPYGSRFPAITVKDMVNVQKRLLNLLGVKHLAMVIGGSMGGMQALQWAVSFPDFMDGIVAIAAPGRASPQSIAYNQVARQTIMLDPGWRQGDYYGGEGPKIGLATARSLGMITYQSEMSFDGKFGRRRRQGRFEVEHYLKYQGEKLVQRFDANSYLCLLQALDNYDLGAGYASYEAALARIKAKVLMVGVSSDVLYPPRQQDELAVAISQNGGWAEYAEIDSIHGHDGFLLDFHLLRPVLMRFIERITAPRRIFRNRKLFSAPKLAYFGARLVAKQMQEKQDAAKCLAKVDRATSLCYDM